MTKFKKPVKDRKRCFSRSDVHVANLCMKRQPSTVIRERRI